MNSRHIMSISAHTHIHSPIHSHGLIVERDWTEKKKYVHIQQNNANYRRIESGPRGER